MSTIRLAKTIELEHILRSIRATYPLLDDSEIIKMIISKYYTDYHMPTRQATLEEDEAIAEGLEDMKNGNYVVWPADEPFDLDELLKKTDEV